MSEIVVASFALKDEDALELLLEAAELPSEDLTPEMLEDFIVAHQGGALVGAAGLERYGEVALLRSVVVEESQRGTGLGKRLVAAMEAQAREAGVQQLYLLTTTADAYFTQLGYSSVAREAAPEAIRNTAQFSSLCPSSSSFMLKTIISP